jgi:hypothetical protein
VPSSSSSHRGAAVHIDEEDEEDIEGEEEAEGLIFDDDEDTICAFAVINKSLISEYSPQPYALLAATRATYPVDGKSPAIRKTGFVKSLAASVHIFDILDVKLTPDVDDAIVAVQT